MLEKLAGRLKWEHSDQGVRIEIPARWGWSAIFAAALVIGYLTAVGFIALSNEWPITYDDRFKLGILCAVVVGIGACCAAAWLAWSFTGRTFVLVNQNEMKIQRKVLGIEWDTRRFASFEIRELQYSPPTEMWAFRTDTDPNTSKIQFQVKNKKVGFAGGITEKEAIALIARLNEICNFTKDS